MSAPFDIGGAIRAAAHGALADTQAWLSRQRQQVGANLQQEAAPVGATFDNLGTAVHNAGLVQGAQAMMGPALGGAPIHPDQPAADNPLDFIRQSIAQAFADRASFLHDQAAQEQQGQGGNLNPLPRLAQTERNIEQGQQGLPGGRQVTYGNAPLVGLPLRAVAAADDTAGLTGELIGKGTNAIAGELALGASAPQAAFGDPRNPATQAAQAAMAQGVAHPGRALTALKDGPDPLSAWLAGGLDLATGLTLPGKQIGIPEELAANLPRLAAAIEAANAVSKASVLPFQMAPIMHPIEATGIPALRRALGAIDGGVDTAPALAPRPGLAGDFPLSSPPAAVPPRALALPAAQSQIMPNVDNSLAPLSANAKTPQATGAGGLLAQLSNPGIQPLAPAVAHALTNPHVLGGLAGATLNGAAALNQGQNPNTPGFWGAVATGGAAGALAGPTLAQLPGAASAIGPNLAGKPAALKAIAQDVLDTQRSVAAVKGGNLNPIANLRALRTISAGVPLRNFFNNVGMLALAGGASPGDYAATVSQMFDRMPQYLSALRAAGNNSQAQERAILEVLPDQGQQLRTQIQQQYIAAGATAADGDNALFAQLQKLGEDYQHTINPGARVSLVQGAFLGGGAAMLGPGVVTGPIALGLGAVRGALLPGRARLQADLLTPIDRGGRFAIAFPAMQDALANGASLDQAGDLAAQRVSRAFADFHRPDVISRGLDILAPGSRWSYEQAKLLAPLVGEHPGLAPAAAVAAATGNYPHADKAEPGHTGTLQFDDQTPGIGLAARALNGGAAGQANVDAAYDFLPFGGSLLNLPYGKLNTQRYPGATPWERALAGMDAAGAPLNPLIGMALAKLGAPTAPSNPDRMGNFGRALDIALGTPQIPNIAPLFKPGEQGGASYDDILAGRVHDPAVDEAINEIAYERTGKPLSDPSNRALMEQTFDPHSELIQAAKTRAGMQLAAQALTSDLAPAPVQGTTAVAHQAAIAEESLRAAGLTEDQIKAFGDAGAAGSPLTGKALADAGFNGNPTRAQYGLAAAQAQLLADLNSVGSKDAVRIYADASMQERGMLLLQYWQAEHSVARAIAPQAYQAHGQKEAERLGLAPAGTTAQAQKSYDQQALGLAPLTGSSILRPLPGVTPLPGAPYQFPVSGLPYESPYQLPPGAGIPSASR